MKVVSLLSGGKDSLYAAYIASQYHELVAGVTVHAQNKESYMFHTPNIALTQMQCEAMQLPHIIVASEGNKEEELEDLKEALIEAKEKYGAQGVVTGAVGSVYQATRIQKICHELGLHCFNPLWQKNQEELLRELLEHKFRVIISGVSAYPLTAEYLGQEITNDLIEKLLTFEQDFQINPAGEGGEIETFVTDCPLFHKEIQVKGGSKEHENYSGIFRIEEAFLEEKVRDHIKPSPIEETSEESADILIVQTTTEPLYYFEYTKPITDIIKEQHRTYALVSLQNIETVQFSKFSKIIITGTGLANNAYQEITLPTTKQPMLGICAGAQLIAKQGNSALIKDVHIGMEQVEPQSKSILTDNITQAYFVHQYTVEPSDDIQPILKTTNGEIAAFQIIDEPKFGILFHPEVRNKELVISFLNTFST